MDAWRQTLSEKNCKILDEQLKSADLVQRQAGGAKICYYYPKSARTAVFDSCEVCIHAATIVLYDDIGKARARMPAKIFVVNGRFFSIEFPKRPDRYMVQHGMDSNRLKVERVNTVTALN